MKRILSWMVMGLVPLLCLPSEAAPSATPTDTANFLKTVLNIAEHNDLTDVAYSKKFLGPNLIVDNDGAKDLHPASGLNLDGKGPGMAPAGDFTYYYSLVPMKTKYQFWKTDDPLFVAEIGFDNVPAFKCITGKDVSDVFHSDDNVGLLNTRSHTFHVSQGPNMVTEIEVDGPVEDDENGCVQSLTIHQHHIAEFVPTGGIGGGPAGNR